MPLNILIAEDSATNRLLFSMTLSRLGHAVDIAANGQEAARMFTENAYDLVFLDLHMPVMNGIETAYAIRQDNAKGVPVYAVSGFPPEDMVGRFQEVGIRRCILKPLDGEKLAEVVAECGLGGASPRESHSTQPFTAMPRRLLQTYANELRARGDACLGNARAGDLTALLREAHTIRSLAGMLELEALDAAAAELERRCEQRAIADHAVRDASRVCNEAADAIEKQIQARAG